MKTLNRILDLLGAVLSRKDATAILSLLVALVAVIGLVTSSWLPLLANR